MKKAVYGLWLFFLLVVVSRIAGRMYGTLGGGFTGSLGALFVLGAAAMLYLVAVIVLSHVWAGIDRMRGRS